MADGDQEQAYPRNAPLIKPNPDPSDATIALILREYKNLKEIIESRLNARDEAVKLLQDHVNKSPSIAEVNLAVLDLEKLHDAKFIAMEGLFDTRFKERDARLDQSSKSTETAVSTAFASAKEAVGVQATSTIEQVKQLTVIINQINKSLEGTINDVKTRVQVIESTKIGMAAVETRQQSSTNMNIVITGIVITGIVGILGLLISVAGFFARAKGIG